MLVRLLEALEKNVNLHGCEINDILYDYDEEICHDCLRDCDECRKASHEILKKLKEEAEKPKEK